MDKFLVHKDVYNEIMLKSFGLDAETIQKAKGLPDGTIREWGGKKYKKTNGKWIPIGKGRKGSKEDPKEMRGPKKPNEEKSNDKTGENKAEKKTTFVSAADNYNTDQEVQFQFGGNTLSGKITAKGKDGVTIHDKDDNIYKVNYNAIGKTTKNADGTIPADSFNANDYKSQFTDKQATPTVQGKLHIYDELLNDKNYDPEVINKAIEMTKKYLDEQDRRIAKKGMTNERFTGGTGEPPYSLERQKLHDKILSKIFTPEKIKACQPAPGEQPKFIMFGGRGGSGKGWFTDKKRAEAAGREVMFDSDKFLTLDADAIKEMIPEFEGWNAGEVHEESSYLMKQAKKMAEAYGMNIIIDGTMNYSSKNPNKVRDEMLHFKNKGYSIEAHYMFLPVQESSKRAIMRFAHKDKKTGKYDFKGRLVPMDILLGMQDNEKSFDSVKDICDNWSFRDNNVPMGEEPKLISQKNNK